ncbi:MAG: hypothetical protein H0T51_06275 [Pirellulales bacterium]|nr:hypothetical protein [Pirellulales bacterium]
MNKSELGTVSRTAGALGAAAAAGLGGAQSSHADVVAQALNLTVPPNYAVDLDGDAIKEFDLIDLGDPGGSEQIIKVHNFAAGVGFVLDSGGMFAANLAPGTLIDSSSTFSAGLPPDDALNGFDSTGPVGKFQVEDPAGYIGVQFLIAGQTHYGYVGFEGVELLAGNEGTEGRVFALGYESTPNTAIAAGAGIPPLAADFDTDGDVDGNDFLVLQRGLGTTHDVDDLTAFQNEFGLLAPPAAAVAVGAIPEPTSLTLLAAGASGVANRIDFLPQAMEAADLN